MPSGILDPLRVAVADLDGPAPTADQRRRAALTAELVHELSFSFMHAKALRRQPLNDDEREAVVEACLRVAGAGRDRADRDRADGGRGAAPADGT